LSSPGRKYRYRGLIWPSALIAIGAVGLLVNTIASDRLYRLLDLWPLGLLVIGLELVLRRTPMPADTAALAAVLILLLAGVGAAVYVAAGAAVPGGVHTINAAAPGTLDHASVELDVGTATLDIAGSDLCDEVFCDLFRAHIEYSGPPPRVSFDRSSGRIEISQSSGFRLFGPPQRFALNLQLNSRVRWGVAVHSGSATSRYDLTRLQLASLGINTGAGREDIALGTPKGKVPVSIHGGALEVHLHRPGGTGADVNVSGKKVSLDFDGRQLRAVGSVGSVGAGTVPGPDMFTIRIDGSACTVTMDARSPGG
jgi:hypothetical protein